MLRGVRKRGMYRGTLRGLVQGLSKEVQWGSKGVISAQLGVKKRSGCSTTQLNGWKRHSACAKFYDST
jgi:hypothetical protein